MIADKDGSEIKNHKNTKIQSQKYKNDSYQIITDHEIYIIYIYI